MLRIQDILNPLPQIQGLELIYPCNCCTKRFILQESLKQHVKTYHAAGPTAVQGTIKPFFCEICCKCFKLQINLERHQSKHQLKKFLVNKQQHSTPKHLADCNLLQAVRDQARANSCIVKRPFLAECTSCNKWFRNRLEFKKHQIRSISWIKDNAGGTRGIWRDITTCIDSPI